MDYVREMVADIARDYSSQLTVVLSNRDEYQEVTPVISGGNDCERFVLWLAGAGGSWAG